MCQPYLRDSKNIKFIDHIENYAVVYLLANGDHVCPVCANGMETLIVGHKIIWYNADEKCSGCNRRLG